MASLFGRLQIVRLVEIHRIDLVELDELQDIDRLRRFRIDLLEVVVVEDHVLTLLVLVTLDDLVPRHRFIFDRADALVLDTPFVLGVKHIEGELVRLDRRKELDGDRYETEIDGSGPNCMRHSPLILPKPDAYHKRLALAKAGSRRCFFQYFGPQRSPSRASRFRVVAMLNFANSSAGAADVRRRENASISAQCSGVETGAPSRARSV